MPEPMTPEERAAVRRRLEADIEDAKKTLQNARAHFERLCGELAELAREERGAANG